jgi:hypothetical protein
VAVEQPPRTLTTEQAAVAVGVTVRTLGRYRRKGAPSQPGPRKTVLWNAEELRAWMRTNGYDGGSGDADVREELPDLGPAPPAVGGLPGGPSPASPPEPTPAAAVAPTPTTPSAPTPLERLRDVRVRKEQLALERQELELAERRGETVSIDEAERLFRAHFVAKKVAMSGWPARVAARLEGLAYDERLGVLEAEIAAFMDELAVVSVSTT